MCVHPKFLHSNATSHKWPFGAVAELLDNAVDEIKTGATRIVVDKIVNKRKGSPALLVQDDGGGMDPDSMRRCMSFGFSDKQSGSSIGQYGNGFKTSTMRLGADAIVFSRCMKGSGPTQSVGLLSYTFLAETGQKDVVVPMVDYKYDLLTGDAIQYERHGADQFCSNLSVLLKWSPFATEEDLMGNEQFSDIGPHGTKIVVFNLWSNDDGVLELDFDTKEEDIMISGAPNPAETTNAVKRTNENHLSNQLRYSLRLPGYFKIILRGQEVQRHSIATDLIYRQAVSYTPLEFLRKKEGEVVTSIGFLNGAPTISVHGFNIYHRNRLILPFHRVLSSASSKGRGVAGVLEANSIKPTHDKQDFEKSQLYQKLIIRLKDMTTEYCGHAPCSMPAAQMVPATDSAETRKRRNEDDVQMDPCKRQAIQSLEVDNQICQHMTERDLNEFEHLKFENQQLHEECLELEVAEKELLLKEQQLRLQIQQAEAQYKSLLNEYISATPVRTRMP
ncbi:MORC family CW-type zinc finger protein 3 [Triticum urartu]|uniref:MORC family CW-type zinc finger protein 3 n=1 Tax=Triticum urartu TaxID=4572 RepID=M7ZXV0_TRIUA|nr:MORC family CW-type zinc finger protein 3 [Triticum urartu]